jgi:hypothetical protein
MSSRVQRMMTQPIVRWFSTPTGGAGCAAPAVATRCAHWNAHSVNNPQNLIFRHLQQKRRVQLYLMESKDMRLEGQIIVRLLRAVLHHPHVAGACVR